MRVAVVGHAEWVTYARVERVPARGTIAFASGWSEGPGGGGAVPALELARLGAEVDFLCPLGDDEAGSRLRAALEDAGVRVHGAVRPRPQRRAVALVDDGAERTIVVLGEPLDPRGDDDLPWDVLDGAAGCYLASGDAGAVRAARRAGVLVANARAGPSLAAAAVSLDVLLHSGDDPDEDPARLGLDPPPDAVVTTLGAAGGRWRAGEETGEWTAAPVPGEPVDAYGCGDCFAAALTLELAGGGGLGAAVERGAAAGAACLARLGP